MKIIRTSGCVKDELTCASGADTDPAGRPCSLSPDLRDRDPARFFPKSPLSSPDSVCGRSTDYEDFWSPPSPSASPGTTTTTSTTTSTVMRSEPSQLMVLGI